MGLHYGLGGAVGWGFRVSLLLQGSLVLHIFQAFAQAIAQCVTKTHENSSSFMRPNHVFKPRDSPKTVSPQRESLNP